MELPPEMAEGPRFDGSLSVLTYNIKGLPWPVALGRSKALRTIASRLRELQSQKRAPDVVVVQEAFTAQARAMGAAAGYRYIVSGPTATDVTAAEMSAADHSFAARASWWKGETEGKYVGSGLQILSNYPVIAVHSMAFPAFACAGFDCLANKGALLVTLDIPGAASPIDIVTTHLNSRTASRVPDERSIYAYRKQVEALAQFIRRTHNPRYPLIAAGDFNVGSALPRRTALIDAVRSEWAPGTSVRDALNDYRNHGKILNSDAAYSLERARDWQFYSDGTAQKLTLTGIDVPFGRNDIDGMLSDHVGYVARFRLDMPDTGKSDGPVTSFALSKKLRF